MSYTVCHAPSCDGVIVLQDRIGSFPTRAEAIAYAVRLKRPNLEILIESLPLQRGHCGFWLSGFRNADGTWKASR